MKKKSFGILICLCMLFGIMPVHDATWQGVVEANGEEYHSQSELQIAKMSIPDKKHPNSYN